MTRRYTSRCAAVAALSLLLGMAGVRAQSSQPATAAADKDVDIMLMWHGGAAGVPFDMPLPAGGPDMAFMTAPLGIAGETVTGAPYSADAVSEMVQTLADGNRIVHESKTSLYRDAAGRTRREQGLAIIGPLVGGSTPGVQVHISDPVAGVNYMLDMEQRQAVKMPLPRIRIATGPGSPAPGGGVGGGMGAGVGVGGNVETIRRTFNVAVAPPPGGGPNAVFFSRSAVASANMGTPVVEQLGKQMVEGVEAQGTRSTLTIPAGSVGNERAIVVVSERWYSPELKTLVLTRQSDPRYGETTYRLSNIVRSEPSADLFQVPSDFTVIDPPADGGGNVIMKMERKVLER